MNRHRIAVKAGGIDIAGVLMLTEGVWSFSFQDAGFLSAFLVGTIYSFSPVVAGTAQQSPHAAISMQALTFTKQPS